MTKNNIIVENAKIGFRNFSGKEGKFNAAGRRNFCLFVEPDLGTTLEEDGWNVKWLKPKEEGDEPQAYIQVSVAYGNIQPKIVLISSHGKTVMDEESVDILDWVEIKNVDLIVRPYNWEVNGKSGVKAYIKSLYVTIMEDIFEQKYLDVPDTALKGIAAPKDSDDFIDTEYTEG